MQGEKTSRKGKQRNRCRKNIIGLKIIKTIKNIKEKKKKGKLQRSTKAQRRGRGL